MRLFALLLAALACAAGPAPAASYEVASVRFANAVPEPSPLARRLAREKGTTPRVARPLMLSATLYRPSRPGRHPALVLLHDCRGVLDYQREWAARLAEWGYVALLVDSFSVRGTRATCKQLVDIEAQDVHGGRVFDAYGALEYLATRPFVDQLRIGVLGWAYDAVLGTVIRAGAQQFFERRFKAAVALYPDCGFTASGDFVAPVMVLAGAEDDWTPARVCARMRDRSLQHRHPVELRVYPGARHAFDDPSAAGGVYLGEVRNLYRQPALGATLRYDADARQAALLDVHDFLETRIRYSSFRGTLDDLPAAYSSDQLSAAVWAVDPAYPGPDLPTQGLSTFDLLFAREQAGRRRYAIPYPFAELLSFLDRQVRDPGPQREITSVAIIPRGRSLQREVAAPDYFRYPRIVTAVTREPSETSDERRPLLKDRLFIGYVEKSGVLEVISYNDAMGRFEYQVVRNYRPGAEPDVYYAPRPLCVSCHQNQAPIFPNAPWDETNANGGIRERLAGARAAFYGLPASELGFSVNNIDRAANRANLFGVQNLLWQRLCEADEPRLTAGCRAALYRAVLQFRLSGNNGFARDARFERLFEALAARNWQRRWPGGLKIPFANIPDRDPVALDGTLPVRLDPLTQRAPELIWHWREEDRRDAGVHSRQTAASPLDALIAGLAERLLASDVERLDGYLTRTARPDAPPGTFHGACSGRRDAQRGLAFDYRLECVDATGRALFEARLRSAARGFANGRVDWLEVSPGQHVTGLALTPVAADGDTGVFAIGAGARHARLPNAQRLAALRLTAEDEDRWRVEVDTLDDTAPLESALQALAEQPASPFAAPGALRPVALTRRLFEQLGEPYPAQCCTPPGHLPAPLLEPEPPQRLAGPPLIQRFRATCGACHGGATDVPPGFLNGSDERVLANLTACAERISFRLAMWEQAPDERRKSPMPPIPPAPFGTDTWPGSDALRDLRDAAASLPGAGDPRALTRRAYESLAVCRPGS